MTSGRRTLLLGALVVLIAIGVATPLVLEMRSSSSSSSDAGPACTDEPPSAPDRPPPVDRSPRQRSTEDPYADFRRYVEDRRAAGKPTTLAELLGPDPPDAENAAVEIKAALDALDAQLGEESTWPKVGPWSESGNGTEDETPEGLAELRKFVERFGGFSDRIATALDRPRCRFPIEPLLEKRTRAWLRLGRIRRVLLAESVAASDPVRRVEVARTLLRLSRANEPVSATLDWLTNPAGATSAVCAIRLGIERNELDPVAVRSAMDHLLQADWIATAPGFLRSNEVATLSIYLSWIDDDMDDDVRKLLPGGPPSAADMIESFGLLEEVSRLPSSPFRAYVKSLDEVRERARSMGDASEKQAVHVASLVGRLGEAEAVSRLARVALAAAEFRVTHGDFPESLDDLKPMFPAGVPLNPLTDKPFVYERTATGARIATDPAADDADFESLRRSHGRVWELKR